jgi:hypothetical protein
MKLVPLDRLLELHFEDRSTRMRRRLVSLARAAKLPGAQKLGSQWMCDLEVFESRPANDPPPTAPAASLRELVEAAKAKRAAQ